MQNNKTSITQEPNEERGRERKNWICKQRTQKTVCRRYLAKYAKNLLAKSLAGASTKVLFHRIKLIKNLPKPTAPILTFRLCRCRVSRLIRPTRKTNRTTDSLFSSVCRANFLFMAYYYGSKRDERHPSSHKLFNSYLLGKFYCETRRCLSPSSRNSWSTVSKTHEYKNVFHVEPLNQRMKKCVTLNFERIEATKWHTNA